MPGRVPKFNPYTSPKEWGIVPITVDDLTFGRVRYIRAGRAFFRMPKTSSSPEEPGVAGMPFAPILHIYQEWSGLS